MILPAFVTILATWSLDGSDGGWSPGGTSGQWEWGTPTTGPGGPGGAWATRLDGFALNDAVDFVEIPLPDLSGAAHPVLVLTHWYAFGPGDAGVVQVDAGAGWQDLPPAYGYPDALGFVGDSGGVVEHAFPLGDHGAAPRVRLLFASDDAFSDEGWYVTSAGLYDGDVVPPRITPIAVPGDTTDVRGPYAFVVEAQDDRGPVDVRLVATVGGGAPVVVPFAAEGPDTFRAGLDGLPPGSVVRWYVEADDGEQVARYPDPDDASFRVYLPAPRDLRVVGGRVIGDRVSLQWSAPDSDLPVLGYEVADGDGTRTLAQTAFVAAPVSESGPQTFTVRARFALDDGEALGDPSVPITVDVEVPWLAPLEPAAAGPGERLWVEVTGRSLYLEPTVGDLDFGEDVEVEVLEVIDAERALARLAVRGDAEPGTRDVRVTGAQGAFRFAEAFEVLDVPAAGAEATVTPDVVFQGRPTTLTITTPTPLEGAVTVDPGPDLVVTGEVVVDGDEVRFELLAPLGAVPGPRTLLVDDGTRVLAADLSVRESIAELPKSCAVAPGAGLGSTLIALALLARRRPASVARC